MIRTRRDASRAATWVGRGSSSAVLLVTIPSRGGSDKTVADSETATGQILDALDA